MNGEFFITAGISACVFGTLLGGVLSLVENKRLVSRFARALLMFALVSGAVSAVFFLLQARHSVFIGSGGFFPGKLMLDHLSAIFFFLINAVGLLAVWYGARYIANEKGHYRLSYVQCLTAFFLAGMQFVTLATTPVFFLFAWEMMSFSSFFLVLADGKRTSVRPALFYLIMTHLGAGALLAGFFLLSQGILRVDFSQLAGSVSVLSEGTLLAAFLLFFFGFGSKAGLFPFHGWLPEAHPQAPSHISALMSGIMLKVAVYGFLRTTLFIFPPVSFELGFAVAVVGIFSAIFGVLYSVTETDVKRILAFSSIENLGLIFAMIGVSFAAKSFGMDILAEFGILVALFQSLCHAFFKSGLFFSAGVMGQIFHTRNIEKMGGMAKQMKFFSFGALLLSLTAAALPPSGVFAGEWLFFQILIQYIAAAALPLKVLLLAVLIFFGCVAGMAVFSMVRFFGIAFLALPRSSEANIKKDPAPAMLFPILFLAGGAFFLGPLAQPVMGVLAKNFILADGEKFFSDFSSPFTFHPPVLLFLLIIATLLTFLARRVFSDSRHERIYHTWDCGQPIDASMEYTGTAFSAPIRFFFNMLLRVKKKVIQEPLVSGNPWVVKKSVTIEIKPIWDEYFYGPIARMIKHLSFFVRRLQNGNIQFYISLILFTLILTALVIL